MVVGLFILTLWSAIQIQKEGKVVSKPLSFILFQSKSSKVDVPPKEVSFSYVPYLLSWLSIQSYTFHLHTLQTIKRSQCLWDLSYGNSKLQ